MTFISVEKKDSTIIIFIQTINTMKYCTHFFIDSYNYVSCVSNGILNTIGKFQDNEFTHYDRDVKPTSVLLEDIDYDPFIDRIKSWLDHSSCILVGYVILSNTHRFDLENATITKLITKKNEILVISDIEIPVVGFVGIKETLRDIRIDSLI